MQESDSFMRVFTVWQNNYIMWTKLWQNIYLDAFVKFDVELLFQQLHCSKIDHKVLSHTVFWNKYKRAFSMPIWKHNIYIGKLVNNQYIYSW
jgi:uncharacterized protein YfbU (UPF0304 family)